MAIEESANNISQLNQNFPTADDFVSEGDDHIRLIKKTLKNTFPKVKGICSVSDVQLSNIGTALKDTSSDSEVVWYDTIKLKKNGYIEAKTASRLSDVNQDTLLTVGSMINLVYPVGALYLSTVNTNPAELFGVGTWEPYAQGRTLVGVGNLGSKAIVSGQEFGSQNITLSEANLPAHRHALTEGRVAASGDHDHAQDSNTVVASSPYQSGVDPISGSAPSGKMGGRTQRAGSHTHNLEGNTSMTGQGTPFDNHQPSIGTYIWKRTR